MSNLQTAIDDWNLYSRWPVTRSVEDARAFIAAGYQLLLAPKSSESNTEKVDLDIATIYRAIDRAQKWINVQTVAGSAVRYLKSNPYHGERH